MSGSKQARRLRRQFFRRRFLPLVWADLLSSAVALYAGLLIRFEGEIPPSFLEWFLPSLVLLAPLQVFFMVVFGVYRVQMRYTGLREMIRISYASAIAFLLFVGILGILRYGAAQEPIPRSVMFITFALSTVLFCAIRLVPRLRARGAWGRTDRKPVLVYGTEPVAEQLVRDMLRENHYPYHPAGFIDDNKRMWGTTIHGVPVLGGSRQLEEIVEKTGTDALIIAAPSASTLKIREVLDHARKADIRNIKILPSLDRIVRGEVTVSQVCDVNLDDLMRREPVVIDNRGVSEFLAGKRILVTGAAGSIGSELVRCILAFEPEKLYMLDHDETDLFHLATRLKDQACVEPLIADIRDAERMEDLFSSLRPEVVFHAGAYKHVPMIESHPAEAVKTNIFGTRTVASAAARNGCRTFVLISTDKAVNPTSVMGVTKRIAEMVISCLQERGECRFAAVRFGNVLGSRGSVVPIFKDQIERGGPVTVTHPDMKRYFMTTREAVLLVLEAAFLSKGGEVFVLDMGKPEMIVDLAREMIRLSGYEPDVDIPIVFSGIRPGEKLFEEYLTAEEGTSATLHDKIFTARVTRTCEAPVFEKYLEDLGAACRAKDRDRLIGLFRERVPNYTPTPGTETASWGSAPSPRTARPEVR